MGTASDINLIKLALFKLIKENDAENVPETFSELIVNMKYDQYLYQVRETC